MGSVSKGRPKFRPDSLSFVTHGGLSVRRISQNLEEAKSDDAFAQLSRILNESHGCLFESAYEYPGRYARWSMGFCHPPIMIEGYHLKNLAKITALNSRGEVVLPFLRECLSECDAVEALCSEDNWIEATIKETKKVYSEEERSKKPSLFSIVRSIIRAFSVDIDVDPQLGLYGAFGYNLTFQFEDIDLNQTRLDNDRDLVLYLPDEILVNDRQLSKTWCLKYDFEFQDKSTINLPRSTSYKCDTTSVNNFEEGSDFLPGEYAKKVEEAKEEFKKGNLFEVVLSQTFRYDLKLTNLTPSKVFKRIRQRNPSPYLFLINLGNREFLVGASPEMFVRAEKIVNESKDGYDIRIESCPISGTIKRGKNALEDAKRIQEILSDKKEESELTMCTDVDRNDKSRICKSGSVRVIGRRQIEKYSKLIHTVDHVVGVLREGFDALDAFLVHTWAVTVTGAPKRWAIQFVENNEKSDRKWYGGAVGFLGFDGTMNTGMTLRTIRIKDNMAEIRVGATLLFDSDPISEEKETELKASAFQEVLRAPVTTNERGVHSRDELRSDKKKVLVIDHEDSFVNTLSNYIRELGVEVVTLRFSAINPALLSKIKPDLALMSPGPGNPKDFDCSHTLKLLIAEKIPIFGVCLGLQAIVEYFGGKLGVLNYPMHGKPSRVRRVKGTSSIFDNLPEVFQVGRYHSLYAVDDWFPDVLECIGKTIPEKVGVSKSLEPTIIMGLNHRTMPIAAVQFHPESILTDPNLGLQILRNAINMLVSDQY